jgi:hypothetical protein
MSSHWLAGVVLGGLLNILGSTPTVAAENNLSPTNTSAPSDEHLIGWWKFDDSSGLTAADSSAGKHPGTLEGGLAFEKNSVPGRIGKAIQLDGKDARIRIAGFKGVTGPTARTVAAWIQTSSPSGEVVSWGKDEHGAMWIFGFIRGGLGVTPKGGYLYMKASVQDSAWHHVAVVVNEASPPNLHDHVQLYRDGVVAEIDDIGLLDLWPIETGDQQDVVIGRRFKGLIDDLRIYDRALSEDEIAALARPGSEAKPTSSH